MLSTPETEGLDMSDMTEKDRKYLDNLKKQAARSPYLGGDDSADLEQRVAEVRRWEGSAAADQYRRDYQRAYADIPRYRTTKPAPAAPAPALQTRSHTNTLAILAIIFGVGGGVLGIIFGHVALPQIERTGEEGRGLAIAGMVLGYIGVAITVILLIVTRVALAQVGL
jgi:hypothetical protein